MKVFKTIALGLLLLPTITQAQNSKISSDYTVNSGDPYRVVDAPSKEYISHENGYVYMAKMKTEFVTIQKYDVNGMKEVTRNEYDDLPKYAKFQEFIQLNKRIFLIYEAFNKPEDTFTLYAREINTEDGTLNEEQALLTSSRPVKNSNIPVDMSNVKSHNAFTGQGYKFLVEKSQDESKILVHYTLQQISKRDAQNYDEIGFYAFDASLNKLWGTEIKMPYTEAEMDNVCYAITNSGEAKMIINNKISNNYELFSVNKSEELNIVDLNLSTDRLVREFRLREDPNGNLIGAGFYANGIEYKANAFARGTISFNINGLLYFSISNEGEILENKTFDFTEEFIQQNLSKGQKKAVAKREEKGKAGISDLNLTDYIIKDDGSVYCIGEVQFIEINSTYSSTGSSRNSKTYRYRNIVTMKINSDGELVWIKKLPKNQSGSVRLGQMSFSYMETKNADYVAFVDNLKNIDLDSEGGVPAQHKNGAGGFLTTYKIDHETGALEKHTLLDLKDVPGGHNAYQFKTSRIINCGNNDFLLEIYIKGKEDTMVKFHVN